jgi:hypothetical protein
MLMKDPIQLCSRLLIGFLLLSCGSSESELPAGAAPVSLDEPATDDAASSANDSDSSGESRPFESAGIYSWNVPGTDEFALYLHRHKLAGDPANEDWAAAIE